MSDTKIDDGGPAFPCDVQVEDNSGSHYEEHYGLTMRDWFAGQALASMTAAPDYSKGPCNQAIADRAYLIADAMLSARNKKE